MLARFAIVLVAFPLTNGPNVKPRPAMVICLSGSQALTAIKGFPEERIALLITLRGFLWAPEQQIQRKPCLARVTDVANLFEVPPFKGHNHKNVGIGIPAALATGQRAKQSKINDMEALGPIEPVMA